MLPPLSKTEQLSELFGKRLTLFWPQAVQEIKRIEREMQTGNVSTADLEAAKRQLKELRDINLDEASFEDKLDIIGKLGIKVYPSEDLKTMRVTCGFDFEFVDYGE